MPKFIAQPHHGFRLGDFLIEGLRNSNWTFFRAAIAFVKRSGTKHIQTDLAAFSRRANIRISVGIDKGGTSLEGVTDLIAAIGSKGGLWVFKNKRGSTFHPKTYLFKNAFFADLVVGSGNLTEGGLFTNYEASLRVKLDLSDASDAAFLKTVESTLDQWSTATVGLCLPLGRSLVDVLHAAGELPTEAETLAIENRARATTANYDKTLSPFQSNPVQSAPPAPTSNIATTTASKVTLGKSVLKNSASVAPAAAPTKTSAAKATFLTFGMTLQNTDVGVGQKSVGAQARSPEVFIPILALDLNPHFWHWKTKFEPDPRNYTADTAWAGGRAGRLLP